MRTEWTSELHAKELQYHPQGTVSVAHVSSGSMSAAADPGGGILRALSVLERIFQEAEVGNTEY